MALVKNRYFHTIMLVITLGLSSFAFQLISPDTSQAYGQVITLANSHTFSVLAATAVTNVVATVVEGDLGIFPGTAFTGSETVVQTGINYTDGMINSRTIMALSDASSVAESLASQPCRHISPELGGLTLQPGIYCSDIGTFGLTGFLKLENSGSSNGNFAFLTSGAINTAAASQVLLGDGVQAGNIFWVSGAAITLGASSQFSGNALAQTAITSGAGVQITGRLFSLGAAVTVDSNTIILPPETSSISPIVFSPPTPISSPTPFSSSASEVKEVGAELGGQTLTAGIYHSAAALAITGDLTLSGSSTDKFVFQSDAAFTYAAGSRVLLLGGVLAENVSWQIGAAVTTGAGSILVGNVIAQAAVTTGAGSKLDGNIVSQAAITTGAGASTTGTLLSHIATITLG